MGFLDFFFGPKPKHLELDGDLVRKFGFSETAEIACVEAVEKCVIESLAHLKSITPLNRNNVAAEANYLAAYLYLRNSDGIDFNLDYLSDGLLDLIPAGDFEISDHVFLYMELYGEGYFTMKDRYYSKIVYQDSINKFDQYALCVKSYFSRAHRIGYYPKCIGYSVFLSTRNVHTDYSKRESKQENHIFREIYYKIERNRVDILVPQLRIKQSADIFYFADNTIKCSSKDNKLHGTLVFENTSNMDSLMSIELDNIDTCSKTLYYMI